MKDYQVLKKYSVLLGLTISVALIFVSTLLYPGGSMFDPNSVGFDWTKNFFSNLFDENAVNGTVNPSRIWADFGMIFLSASIAVFFIRFSKKIPQKSASGIIKYLGGGGMVFTFLIVTPLHDIMVSISGTLFLLSLFYITVFVLKSKLHLFKFLCVGSLLLFYYTIYLYGFGHFEFLPIMQKITFFSQILLILGLEYFTEKEDFEHIRTTKADV